MTFSNEHKIHELYMKTKLRVRIGASLNRRLLPPLFSPFVFQRIYRFDFRIYFPSSKSSTFLKEFSSKNFLPLGTPSFASQNSWACQKIKIMFHVFQHGGGGMARNFSKSQSLYSGGGRLHLWAYVLCAHGSCLRKSPPQTLAILRNYYCKLTGRVYSLYGGDKRVTPRQQVLIEGRGNSAFFQIPEPISV